MTCVELQALLDAALAARHTAILGGAVQSVGVGEHSITYAKGDPARLDAYIRNLQAQMCRQGCILSPCSGSRVFGVIPVDSNTGR